MAGLVVAGQTGVQALQDGVSTPPRLIRTGEFGVSEIHGRFYEQTYRGNVYSGGMALTSISNVTYTTGTLGATVTPVAGIYNPIGSPVNAVVWQATLGVTVTALINTGGGPYVWATSLTTSAVTTGTTGFNRKTLQAVGGQVKDITNTTPTGLTPNLAVRFGSALFGGRFSNINGPDTAVGWSTGQQSSVENFDGSLIVPPGGVLVLLATTTPVAMSAVSSIVWEEVAL